eukprot:3275093-Pyramimonas_sp.AAC.1
MNGQIGEESDRQSGEEGLHSMENLRNMLTFACPLGSQMTASSSESARLPRLRRRSIGSRSDRLRAGTGVPTSRT